MDGEESYFDGGLLQLIGWRILGALITTLTLGICFPWACCMIYNWEVKHTVINGRRLMFTGTAMQLFGSWIKWLLLTIITLVLSLVSCAVMGYVGHTGGQIKHDEFRSESPIQYMVDNGCDKA